jgi:hypothetical protein
LKIPASLMLWVATQSVPVRGHALVLGCALLLAAVVAGCAPTGAMRGGSTATPDSPAALPSAPAPRPGMPSNVEPPPPAVNLSGFPLPYRQGYADGCASAGGSERKDAARFGSDGNYRTGWQDGLALCRKK